jgi:hypothetical protein
VAGRGAPLLRQNPHVVLTTGCNQWEKGIDVVVEGDAVQVTAAGTLERLATAWAGKWKEGAFQPDELSVLKSGRKMGT